jgi:hypothetical protein
MSFVNFSNHALDQWNEDQKAAAQALAGEIVTIPFPNVPATATAEEVDRLAERSVAEILVREPEYAMVQGEFTLAFALPASSWPQASVALPRAASETRR